MVKLIFLLLFIPFISKAHPGVGIVKDSKGNIYYTDLKQVWKISNGKKTIAIPNVHTHELYIDKNDNLFGENGYYDNQSQKFFHYLWVYKPNGKVDTVIGMKEQYIFHNFSLARDKNGNEFYSKRFLRPHTDTNNIYKKSPDGKETIYARGNFKHVNWLHPQEDGNIIFVSDNIIYKADSNGNITIVKEQVANPQPSFKFSGTNITIWGVWQDNHKNVYAAVFSDQAVKKIDSTGVMTEIYKSKDNWTPLHGVFDNDNVLWVLEGSDKNDVRVTKVSTTATASGQILKKSSNLFTYMISSVIILSILCYIIFKKTTLRFN